MAKADKRRMNEKMKRDQLNDKLQELLEKQRLYHKLVKEFKEVRFTLLDIAMDGSSDFVRKLVVF